MVGTVFVQDELNIPHTSFERVWVSLIYELWQKSNETDFYQCYLVQNSSYTAMDTLFPLLVAALEIYNQSVITKQVIKLRPLKTFFQYTKKEKITKAGVRWIWGTTERQGYLLGSKILWRFLVPFYLRHVKTFSTKIWWAVNLFKFHCSLNILNVKQRFDLTTVFTLYEVFVGFRRLPERYSFSMCFLLLPIKHI